MASARRKQRDPVQCAMGGAHRRPRMVERDTMSVLNGGLACAECAAHSRLVQALRETTDILGRIYRGEPVAGRVLDAIDSARDALAMTKARHG